MYTIGFSSEKNPENNFVKKFDTWQGLHSGIIDKHLAVIVDYYASRCEDKLSIAIAMNGDTLLITFE